MNNQVKLEKQRLTKDIQQLVRSAYEVGRQHGRAEAEAEAQQANPQAEAPIVTTAPYWRKHRSSK